MSLKVIVISLFGVVIFIIGIAFVFTRGKTPSPAKAGYSAENSDRPKVEVSGTFFDLGEMKVSDVGKKDFELKNTGTKPLQILNINSSCGCTVGQLIYQGNESKEYGMHAQSGYVAEVAPGDTATIRVIYRPAVMPVYGPVERDVYVTTNDPDNSKLIFRVKAVVK
jgi:hypothetical protein